MACCTHATCNLPACLLPQHRFGQTTQLLADSAQKGALEEGEHAAAMAGGRVAGPRASGMHMPRRRASAAAAGGASATDVDCTTKLLADATGASACGLMSLAPPQHGPLLASTIAGGAPVVQPAAGAGVFGSAAAAAPAFGAGAPAPAVAAYGSAAARAPSASPLVAAAAAAAASPYAAAGSASPLGHWQQQQGRSPSASPLSMGLAAGAAGVSPAAGGADEPTLELAGGVSQGLVGGASSLEDATLQDFALPPEMAAAEERPITMPFSGTLTAAAAFQGCCCPGLHSQPTEWPFARSAPLRACLLLLTRMHP